MKISRLFLVCIVFISVVSCDSGQTTKTLFTEVSSKQSGVDFENRLKFDQQFNIYTYRNFYNGGGVALGDINNDGLIDIYFTANQGANRLYLNKGNFSFEDITQKAGVAGIKAWTTHLQNKQKSMELPTGVLQRMPYSWIMIMTMILIFISSIIPIRPLEVLTS
jgi:enediyne biosynthesis protein E4